MFKTIVENARNATKKIAAVTVLTASVLAAAPAASAMTIPAGDITTDTTAVTGRVVIAAVHVTNERNDLRRQAAAQRTSRFAIRGGAPRFMDSGDVVWAGQPKWIRDVGLCIRRHESLHSGHYRAHNGHSSAAGAYQFLTGTWQGNARYAKFHGKYVARKYATAGQAPAWVQDVVFIHSVKGGGLHAWLGTNCPGTG